MVLGSVQSAPGLARLSERDERFENLGDAVPAHANKPAGDLLAESCSDDLRVQIWNLDANPPAPPTSLYHRDKVNDLSWHPRGELLATACGDCCVYLWNINSTDEPIKKLVGHESAVTGVAFNHRGTLIATLGQDETVRLWFPAIDKTQVARMVKLVLGVEVRNNHAADALAVAICHATAPRRSEVVH